MTAPESQLTYVPAEDPQGADGIARAADESARAADDSGTLADDASQSVEGDGSAECFPDATDRSWIPPAVTAIVALGSLLAFGVSQFLVSREPNRPTFVGDAVATVNGVPTDELPAGPPVATAAGGPYFLPKPPSTGHLLAGKKPAPQVALLPRVEVAAPVAVKPAQPKPPGPEPLDPKHAAAVAEFAARITDLDQQREVLVKQRADTVAEQARLERIVEQGKKDIKTMTEKAVANEVAILAIDLEIDAYQDLFSLPLNNIRAVTINTARSRLPLLFQQKAKLRVDIEKLRTEAEKTRIRNESSYRQWLTLPPRIKQFGEQAEYLRKQWISDCCDWYGKRTAAENGEAVRLFTTALEKNSSNFSAKIGRAVALTRLGQTAAALADLADAEDRTNPFRAEALALRGYLKTFDGDEAKGVAEMGRAATFDRRSIIPWLLRGQVAAHNGRFPGALTDFKAAAAIDATSADARPSITPRPNTAGHATCANPKPPPDKPST